MLAVGGGGDAVFFFEFPIKAATGIEANGDGDFIDGHFGGGKIIFGGLNSLIHKNGMERFAIAALNDAIELAGADIKLFGHLADIDFFIIIIGDQMIQLHHKMDIARARGLTGIGLGGGDRLAFKIKQAQNLLHRPRGGKEGAGGIGEQGDGFANQLGLAAIKKDIFFAHKGGEHFIKIGAMLVFDLGA